MDSDLKLMLNAAEFEVPEAHSLPDMARCLSYYKERSGGQLWRHMRYPWLNCEWTAERLVKYEKAVPAVYVPECNKTKLNMSDKAKVDGRFIKETAFGVHAEVISKTDDTALKPTAMDTCFGVDGSVTTFSNGVATEQDLKHIEGPKSDTLDDDIQILPDVTRCLGYYKERPGEIIRRHIRYAWLNCKWTAERLIKYEKAVPAVYVKECDKTKLNVSNVDGRFAKETTFGVDAEVKTEVTELKPTAIETCFGVDGSVTVFSHGVVTKQDLKPIEVAETIKTSSQSGFKKMAKKIKNLFRRSENKA